MFELEEAIKKWRGSLLQNQNMLEFDVDELESHVRDEVDSLMLAGLDTEEAFMVSTHRIGDRDTVGQEFAKVNPSLAWRRRAFWMFFGILVSMLVGGIASICSTASATFLAWLNVNSYISGVASILVQIGVFLALLFGSIFGLGLFSKSIKRKFSMSKVLILSAVSIVLLKIGAVALTIIQVNYLVLENLGKVHLARNYTNFAWNILWPLIVMVMLFVLWSSRPQKVH